MQQPKKNWLYQVAVVLYRLVFSLYFGGKVVLREVIPESGGFVLMGNHIHFLDPFTMGLAAPGRELFYMGKAELFRNKLLAKLLRYLHAFPVGRGQMDLSAMRTAMKILKEGDGLGIFPEGSRSRDGNIGPLHSGAAVLALKCNVPIIPVFISGRYRFRGKLRVVIGDPIVIDDLREQGADKAASDAFLLRMQEAFEMLRARSRD